MNKNTFIEVLTEKQKIQQLETVELKSTVDAYPYFQSARALYLKGLKNQDSFKYNNELKITAAYTTDRTVLFDFITSKKFTNPNEEIHQQIIDKISDETSFKSEDVEPEVTSTKEEVPEEIKQEESTSIETISEEIEVETTKKPIEETVVEPVQETEEKLEIGKPIAFSTSENHSFNQWLQLSTKKPVVRAESSPKKVSKKVKIIEKFIQSNPKIEPLSKDKKVSISVSKNTQDSSLMTETLAKVYLEQKKYENAIQAYRILSLKYPEKSGFFADQIKRVQILQKHK
ncbi:hypothetical protein BW723_02350 [Polaribacter reichenbachii]|uniref:Tetratricopeptide repeat protein n=1 Tax=Polaribacter reichenbachii TaxID=996801 RepID=A0A1B8TVH8_9FLAO|nr:hypothetical protein [Polaribacter reichenbachii]APZ45206.1 hypothetical protein BW723_02350 [Polaribacter reichenbachii]AUC19069.1 hypothetical protein BTO17_10355 [Polaribacter reichenbachii]OBY63776.1 hypothetical protein LPB301_13350 [Polaribacter reichenbachii]